MSQTNRNRPDNIRGLVMMHFAALLAGVTGLFGKLICGGPTVITAGRAVIAFLTLAMIAKVTGTNLRIGNRRDIGVIAASGALLAAHWATFFYSIQVSSVSVGLLTFASYPLFVTFLEPLFFREKVHGYDIFAALVVIAGLALIAPGFDIGDRTTQGVLWGLLSGALCAATALLNRRSVGNHSTLAIAFWQQGFTALCSLPFAIVKAPAISGRSIVLLVLLGVIFTAGLQMLFVESLRHIRVRTSSIIIMLEPVYGIGFAVLFLGENPAMRTWVGGALVFGAVLGVTLKHASTPKTPTS